MTRPISAAGGVGRGGRRARRLDHRKVRGGELADSIIEKSEVAIAAGKQVYYRQLEMGLETAYMYASEEMARNMMFHDAGEGIDAFIGKRKPSWRHR